MVRKRGNIVPSEYTKSREDTKERRETNQRVGTEAPGLMTRSEERGCCGGGALGAGRLGAAQARQKAPPTQPSLPHCRAAMPLST